MTRDLLPLPMPGASGRGAEPVASKLGHSAECTVLMYHAVMDGGVGSGDHADRRYAVDWCAFDQQLELLESAGQRPCSVLDLVSGAERVSDVAVTFDDGHASNERAARRLADRGQSADFFVNPQTVGQANFLSWSELRSMADAGMSIQSHGWSHRYLDDLTPSEVRSELQRSKEVIEDQLARPVTLFAPPGGRCPPRFAAVAEAAGYTYVCSSRADFWRRSEPGNDIPRIAVLHQTSLRQFQDWVSRDPVAMRLHRTRHRVLGAAKGLLGNQRYERIRRVVLGEGGD